MNNKKIKIAIGGHQKLFRESLTLLLETNKGLETIQGFADGRELLEALKTTMIDIVLLDTIIETIDAKNILDIIKTRYPETKVIMLAAKSDAKLRADFMSYGAGAFLSKTTDVATLFKAIHKVNTEGIYLDSTTSRALLESVLKEKQKSILTGVHFNEKEMDVLTAICDGFTNKQIGAKLNLSSSTIDFYRGKIYEKTKCNNVASLFKYALKNGLIVIAE